MTCSLLQAVLALQFVLDMKQQLWLTGLHEIAVDPMLSKGNTTTFTERWGEFMSGTGPPPAPQLSQNTAYDTIAQQVALRSAEEDCCQGAASATAATRAMLSGSCKSMQGSTNGIKQLTKQFFPLLAVDVESLPSCRPQSADAGLRVGQSPSWPVRHLTPRLS